jgi:hypothetical protein
MESPHLHAAVFITTASVDVGADDRLPVGTALFQVIQ